jgi:plasmid stabilization system protein ParE
MVSDKSEKLAVEFKQEVNKEIDYINQNPEHYQLRYKELLQSLVTRFPYAIFYLVEEEQKRIIIFGILHTSRDPEITRKRI